MCAGYRFLLKIDEFVSDRMDVKKKTFEGWTVVGLDWEQ